MNKKADEVEDLTSNLQNLSIQSDEKDDGGLKQPREQNTNSGSSAPEEIEHCSATSDPQNPSRYDELTQSQDNDIGPPILEPMVFGAMSTRPEQDCYPDPPILEPMVPPLPETDSEEDSFYTCLESDSIARIKIILKKTSF
ncbi:hypothetical protein NPIL_160871 [Nephila pilipes]|uniref:Uncharacterized protein n=1 Tax=Nephila pilipes TaxID=299642 RepID=A0A8X6TGV4_NEPPI|nr:hypothetical protein NPIL_160872 [Nephila pilipes]GFT07191.1 hypothetical protein NPIL_160871 [Nephila pilipes]